MNRASNPAPSDVLAVGVQDVGLLPDVIPCERITLRRPTDEDVPLLVRLRVDPEVRRYLGGPVDRALAERRARAVVGSAAHLVITEDETDAAVGLVSVTPRGTEHELSYSLLPAFWGRGFAAESVTAVVAHVLRPKGPLMTLLAVTQAANERSRALLERTGFALECTIEEFGEPQAVFRLMADDV